ncbi:hypothetical protein ARMSODRAFT_799629 [Armillaria solidipes]|uniref:Uncharacterized protein n=1 Tax=Armillaria solidipes TaxID=1076256 RepID=A0A2H3B039_9AGAR|nr:hypothetical protein ARMSODRAFT_799629 [Armillaria solidipes]
MFASSFCALKYDKDISVVILCLCLIVSLLDEANRYMFAQTVFCPNDYVPTTSSSASWIFEDGQTIFFEKKLSLHLFYLVPSTSALFRQHSVIGAFHYLCR